MTALAMANLVQLDLPGPITVRWSEGAEIKWGSDLFAPRHSTYGAIAGAETGEEGIGNEVPSAQLTVHPPGTTAAAALVMPGAQKSRLRAWMVEYNPATSMVVTGGTIEPLFDGWLDQSRLVRGRSTLALEISVVSMLEQLFEANTGNSLNPTFHKSVWPGETGEDQATGLVLQDAWGTEAPPASGTNLLAGVAQSRGGGAWWVGRGG